MDTLLLVQNISTWIYYGAMSTVCTRVHAYELID